MTWARVAIAVIIALPLGAVAGTFYANQHIAPQLAGLAEERDAIKKQQESIEKALEEAKARAESLEREKRHLEDRLASVAKPDVPSVDTLEGTEGPEDAILADGGQEADATAARSVRGNYGDNDGETDAEREARMQQWREEREQRMAEFRDRMRTFMDEQIQGAPDKATQDRLATMQAYSENMMELFQQMRDAQTDEERDAIRAQLEETGTAARELVREHQDYLLRESLRQNGVSDPKAQEAIMQSLRQTMEGPFFRGPMAGWGGGGGPRGSGWWGGRGRGGQ